MNKLLVILSLSLLMFFVSSANSSVRIHFIDIGQGDATLVEFGCGAILIDAGGERWPADEKETAKYDSNVLLYSYLNWFFNQRKDLNRTLDALYLTHPHKDHTRGVEIVLDEFSPRNIIHNGEERIGSGIYGQNLAQEYAYENDDVSMWYVLEHTIKASKGLSNDVIDPLDTCEYDGVDPIITMLWGTVKDNKHWNTADFKDENNHSLVIRVDYGGSSVLFPGDIEEYYVKPNRRTSTPKFKSGIERLVEKHKNTGLLDVDVLHVGHHGSHNGNTTAFARATSPEIAVLSMGAACRRDDYSAWSHAHPRKETLDELLPEISGTRKEKEILYFARHKSKPKSQKIEKALYGTGWDGNIVLEGDEAGAWKVKSLSGPDLCLK